MFSKIAHPVRAQVIAAIQAKFREMRGKLKGAMEEHDRRVKQMDDEHFEVISQMTHRHHVAKADVAAEISAKVIKELF